MCTNTADVSLVAEFPKLYAGLCSDQSHDSPCSGVQIRQFNPVISLFVA